MEKQYMSLPRFLCQGSVIGITCPSSYVSQERVAYCAKMLTDRGYRVKHGKTIGPGRFYFSGTDDERLADLQEMMDDPEVAAILMGRGGYGMSRIIDRLNFTAFVQRPKWICGFSDIVVLHAHIQANYGIATLHSPMCGHFKPETAQSPFLESFFDALAGGPLHYEIAPAMHNRPGDATGVLTGGNLAILAHLTGTVSEVDMTGKILLIEDIGEYLYSLDRMMMQLKRAGKLAHLRGLVLGGFTETQDTTPGFGQTVEEIIWDKVREYDYPVCFHLPVGHMDINYTLMLGAPHRLSVSANGATLDWLKD